MERNIIWSNINLDPKDWKEAYIETAEINNWDEDTDDEDNLYEFMIQLNNDYLDDERLNLSIKVDGRILAIADLGGWNGRVQGYKIIESGNIKDILSSDCEYCEWYGDGYNIKATMIHHDGINYVEYRMIREDTNIDNLLKSIYNGENISRSKLNKYTKSLYKYVKDIYGWR